MVGNSRRISSYVMYPRSLPIRMSASTLFCRLSPAPFFVEAEAEAAFLCRAFAAFALLLIARTFLAAARFFVRETRALRTGPLAVVRPRARRFAHFTAFRFFCFFFFMLQKVGREESLPYRRSFEFI